MEQINPQREKTPTHSGKCTDTHQEPEPGFRGTAAAWDLICEKFKLGLLCLLHVLPKEHASYETRIGLDPASYEAFRRGYRCSSVCIGCILPWLLMLCRSTLLSPQSDELTGNGFLLGNQPWFHVFTLVVFVYGRPVSSSLRHMQFIEYFFYCRLVEGASSTHGREEKETHHYSEVLTDTDCF